MIAATTIGALGVWGLTADRSSTPTQGQEIRLKGGTMRVDASWVTGDPMAAMHSSTDQFAQSGMAMPSMLPDAVPEGMQRVAVQLHFAANVDSELVFPSKGFTLRVAGQSYGPHVALLGDGRLEGGEQLDGVVTFDIPDSASTAILHGADGDVLAEVDFAGGGDPHDADHG